MKYRIWGTCGQKGNAEILVKDVDMFGGNVFKIGEWCPYRNRSFCEWLEFSG